MIYDAGTVYGTGLIGISTRLAFDRTATRPEREIIEPTCAAKPSGS